MNLVLHESAVPDELIQAEFLQNGPAIRVTLALGQIRIESPCQFH